MQTGMIFDIKEFAIHDGPGIRTTVFLKGCPLKCMWCHNPEGLSPDPQMVISPAGDRLAGQIYTSAELAEMLTRQAPLLKANEGGVTFSGGEPLMQADFLVEVIDQLDDLHILLDTAGNGDSQQFCRLLKRVNLVYYDLKLMDSEAHNRFTGVDNQLILENLKVLSESGIPFVIRVPLIPAITDTAENLAAIAAAIRDLPGLVEVDLLPYNRAAGAKYPACGMVWQPDYDENQPVIARTDIFERAGIRVSIK
jgi:pyruvate formate lyase activating enzyme